MQKVQPLPFLGELRYRYWVYIVKYINWCFVWLHTDEEIHKYVQVIEASIPDAKKVNDGG